MKKLFVTLFTLGLMTLSANAWDASERVSTVGKTLLEKNGLPTAITFKVVEGIADNSQATTTNIINISKEDNETGTKAQGEASLKGAIYGVYARSTIYDPADNSVIYNANAKVGELITDDNAKASLSNLYLGEYYIKEITASKGYTLDTNIYNFDLTYENQNVNVVSKSITVKERVKSQAFRVIKVSSDNNGEAELLKGVEFTIKSQKDIDAYGSWEKAPIAKNYKGQESTVLVTDSKGYIVWVPGLKKSKFDKSKNDSYDIVLKYY